MQVLSIQIAGTIMNLSGVGGTDMTPEDETSNDDFWN